VNFLLQSHSAVQVYKIRNREKVHSFAIKFTMLLSHVVIGPPGSGKSTYCLHIANFMRKIGRKVVIINLDPANDETLPYIPDLCITDLVRVEEVMGLLNLGPNGALMHAMEYLDNNFEWLESYVKKIKPKHFVILDFPGQVELFTNSGAVRSVLKKLEKLHMRICAVNLIDSHHCVEAAKYVAGLLISLSSMFHLELPQINILSKIDLVEKYESDLAFSLDYYTDVLDLSYLVDCLDAETVLPQFKKLNLGLSSLIEDYGLVSFVPLDITKKESVWKAIAAVDKALGYVPSNEEDDRIQEYISAEPEQEVDENLMKL